MIKYFGEWCYAKHSIEYTSLPGYFMLFAIRHITEQYGNLWAPWEYVSEVARELEIPTVPVIWRGEVNSAKDLEKLTLKLASMPSMCGGVREGLVVRYEEQFNDDRFPEFVMKFVRKNHVQTTEHWKDQEIVKNGLKKMSVFILSYSGTDIVSIHKSADEAKYQGDWKFREGYKGSMVVEEWEFDQRISKNVWFKFHNEDWKQTVEGYC